LTKFSDVRAGVVGDATAFPINFFWQN